MSAHLLRIPELVIPGKPLGRHLDLRTAGRRQVAGPPPLAKKVVSVRHASGGLPLNQSTVGSCTLESLCGVCNSVPHWKPGNPTLDQAQAYAGYSVEQELMGYGPYPPADNGGTGQFSCEAGIKMGWLDSFDVCAADLQEWLLALVLRPISIGINWYTSFDTCDPTTGIVSIAAGATVRGGHQIAADEIDAVEELVWFWQSWGLGVYGLNGSGRFAIRFSDLATLIQQGADAVVPRTAKGWVANPAAA